MSCNKVGIFACVALGTGLSVAWPASFLMASTSRNCFTEIERGRGQMITCEFPTRLTEEERRELRSLTRDMVHDASCFVSVSIDRAQVSAALVAENLEFTAPPQPVTCEVSTADKIYPITGTFTPRIVFQAGEAVQGTPGLADVAGVPGYLSWPVVQYVNRSANVRDGMLRVINGYRAYHLARQTMAGRR